MGGQAQSAVGFEWAEAPHRTVPLDDSTEKGRAEVRRIALRDRRSSASGTSGKPSQSFRFGQALAGGTIGVAAGTGLGLLLWRAAAGEGLGDDRYGRPWHDEPDAASALFGLGLLAIVAGGPIGAVEGGGIEERRTDAYVVATIGEVVLGGLGYGLVHELNGGTAGQLTGLGVGAALGSTVGTALVASQGTQSAVAYRNGTWQVAPPDIRVRPPVGPNGSPSVDVPLLSMRW